MKSSYNERFLRSIGITDLEGLKKARSTRIAIGGLGLGGSIFLNLVRMGFEKFHVADPDVYERTNINRQRMAKESTIQGRKDSVLIAEAKDINPDIEVISFAEGVQAGNVDQFLDEVDWVVDTVDVYALREKLLLNEVARLRGIPVVSCGSLGFAAALIVFDKSTPSFAELTGLEADADPLVNLRRFAHFLCPEVPSYMQAQMEKAFRRESHIPFVVPGVEIAAACAATEIAKQVWNIGKILRAPQGMFIDPVNLKYEIFETSHLAKRTKQPLKKVA